MKWKMSILAAALMVLGQPAGFGISGVNAMSPKGDPSRIPYDAQNDARRGTPRLEVPGTVLREGIGKLQGYLQGAAAQDPVRLGIFLEQEIAPYFDFAAMAHWSAGPDYRHMSRAQRSRWEIQLKGLFLSAMARHLAGYRPGGVRYLPPRMNRRGGVVLGLIIQGYPDRNRYYRKRLDFHLFDYTGTWKVIDVVANGQSALTYYRRYFSGSG